MVCVLDQGWNKTLQGCGPPGTEFKTPGLNNPVFPNPVPGGTNSAHFGCLLSDQYIYGPRVSNNELMS